MVRARRSRDAIHFLSNYTHPHRGRNFLFPKPENQRARTNEFRLILLNKLCIESISGRADFFPLHGLGTGISRRRRGFARRFLAKSWGMPLGVRFQNGPPYPLKQGVFRTVRVYQGERAYFRYIACPGRFFPGYRKCNFLNV